MSRKKHKFRLKKPLKMNGGSNFLNGSFSIKGNAANLIQLILNSEK